MRSRGKNRQGLVAGIQKKIQREMAKTQRLEKLEEKLQAINASYEGIESFFVESFKVAMESNG